MSVERRRGFIRTSEQPDDVLERWELPNYNEENEIPKDTAVNYDPSWQPAEAEEDQDGEPLPAPLTAGALEEIQQTGYDEGFTEGKEAGFSEGREAGFAEGKEAGYLEGKETGYQEGLEQGRSEIARRCQLLDSVLEKLSMPLAQVDYEVEQQMLDVIIHLVKSLTRIEVKTNPQIIHSTVREAVAALPMSDRKVTVYLNPEDLSVIAEAHGEEALAERNWRLVAEPALSPGDIQLKSGDSAVDYRIEDRIGELLTQFLGQNHTRPPETAPTIAVEDVEPELPAANPVFENADGNNDKGEPGIPSSGTVGLAGHESAPDTVETATVDPAVTDLEPTDPASTDPTSSGPEHVG